MTEADGAPVAVRESKRTFLKGVYGLEFVATSSTRVLETWVWQPEGAAICVRFSGCALDWIAGRVAETFRAIPHRGESTGILLGRKTLERGRATIHVDSAEEVRCEDPPAPPFQLSGPDTDRLAAHLQRLKAEGQVAVGLYRSVTPDKTDIGGLSIDRTGADLLERLFPRAVSLFLMIRPGSGFHGRARLWMWHSGRPMQDSGPIEFPFQGPPSDRDVAERPPANRSAAPASRSGFAVRHATRLVRACIVLACLAGAGAGFGLIAYKEAAKRAHALAPAQLGLGIRAVPGWVSIEWNPGMPAFQEAVTGGLTIRDGAHENRLSLDAAQLRSGKMLYVPSTTEVRVRMETKDAQGRVKTESVIFIEPQTAPGPERKAD